MADCELEMTTLEGGDGEAHELRQQAIALQETEASEDDFRAAEEDALAGPSQLVLGTTSAPDGEIETEGSTHVQVRKQGRIATDDGRAHKARQTVRGSGSFTMERLKQARQKRALSPLPRAVSVSLSNPEAADDQHSEADAHGEAESPTDSTESNAEDERISTASIAQVNVGPSGKPHISLYQVFQFIQYF